MLVFGDVDVFGALRVEGVKVLLQWVQERKEEDKSEIVRKTTLLTAPCPLWLLSPQVHLSTPQTC